VLDVSVGPAGGCDVSPLLVLLMGALRLLGGWSAWLLGWKAGSGDSYPLQRHLCHIAAVRRW
jgi:hypothetical protein